MARSSTRSGHPRQPAEARSETAVSSRLAAATRSPLTLLLVVVFSIDAMTALVVIAYGQSYLIDTLHAPSSYPAYALAIYGFVKLLTAPIGGWLIDRVRASLVILFAFAVEAAGLGIILGTETANGFLWGVALLSTGIALAWLIVFNALGDATNPDVRASDTAYVGLTSAAATGTGFGLAAFIGETHYWQAAFVAGIVLASVSSVLMFWLYPMAEHARQANQPITGAAEEEHSRMQLVAAAVIFSHFVAVTATIAVFGPFVLRTLGMSLLHAGVLLIPAGAAGALAMLIAGKVSKHGNRLREVALLYALGALAVLAVSLVQNEFVFALVAIPLAISIGGSQPLLNASLLDVSHAADRTGVVLGWLFFAEGLGSVAGPLIVGIVIEFADVRAGVVTLSVIDALLVGLAMLGSRFVRL